MLEQIHILLKQEPFQPFQIILTNGDRYEVRNPALVVVQETQIYYAYPRSDRFALLRLNQIAAVETLQQKAA